MTEAMLLESINIAKVETIRHNNKSLSSGICKYPITGPAYIDEAGVRDDAIVDVENHGGADQAIYAYSADDYSWWASETSRDYSPGLFGENLTIRGMPTDMNIGDRMLIGELVLEATAPRIPCTTLVTRMQDSGFAFEFRKAERPGIYFRVLNAGEVSAGDTVTLVASDSNNVSVLELFRFHYALRHDASQLHRFLAAPLAVRVREDVEDKLATLDHLLD